MISSWSMRRHVVARPDGGFDGWSKRISRSIRFPAYGLLYTWNHKVDGGQQVALIVRIDTSDDVR